MHSITSVTAHPANHEQLILIDYIGGPFNVQVVAEIVEDCFHASCTKQPEPTQVRVQLGLGTRVRGVRVGDLTSGLGEFCSLQGSNHVPFLV